MWSGTSQLEKEKFCIHMGVCKWTKAGNRVWGCGYMPSPRLCDCVCVSYSVLYSPGAVDMATTYWDCFKQKQVNHFDSFVNSPSMQETLGYIPSTTEWCPARIPALGSGLQEDTCIQELPQQHRSLLPACLEITIFKPSNSDKEALGAGQSWVVQLPSVGMTYIGHHAQPSEFTWTV